MDYSCREVDFKPDQLIRTYNINSVIAILGKTLQINPEYSLEVMLNPHLPNSVLNNVRILAQTPHQDETTTVSQSDTYMYCWVLGAYSSYPKIVVAKVANNPIHVAFPGWYCPAPDRPTQEHCNALYNYRIKRAADTIVHQHSTY